MPAVCSGQEHSTEALQPKWWPRGWHSVFPVWLSPLECCAGRGWAGGQGRHPDPASAQHPENCECAACELCFPCSTWWHLELQGEDWTYPAPYGLIADRTERAAWWCLHEAAAFYWLEFLPSSTQCRVRWCSKNSTVCRTRQNSRVSHTHCFCCCENRTVMFNALVENVGVAQPPRPPPFGPILSPSIPIPKIL